MTTKDRGNTSPPWGSTIKLIVGLTGVGIFAILIITFRNFIAPLLLAFILVYLLHPIVNRLHKWFRLPWRIAVTLIYIVSIVIVVGLLVWGGFYLIDQFQNLIQFLDRTIKSLPDYINQLSTLVFYIGPFTLDMKQLDLTAVGNQILNSVQPMLSNVGTLVGSLASGTLVTLGWGFFILMVSYFVLNESGGVSDRIINIQIPGYKEDWQRMSRELAHIWNAFLRGQLLVLTIAVLIYVVVLGVWGVHFFYGLAFLAAFARLIPYIGPFLAWTTYGLVCYFQPEHPFGLLPIVYALLVIGTAIITDSIIDNLISPRILADTLKVHPAAVMVVALIAVSLFGVVGAILAAPVLATTLLFARYVFRKMLDLDPWENMKTTGTPPPLRLTAYSHHIWVKLRKRFKKTFNTGSFQGNNQDGQPK